MTQPWDSVIQRYVEYMEGRQHNFYKQESIAPVSFGDVAECLYRRLDSGLLIQWNIFNYLKSACLTDDISFVKFLLSPEFAYDPEYNGNCSYSVFSFGISNSFIVKMLIMYGFDIDHCPRMTKHWRRPGVWSPIDCAYMYLLDDEQGEYFDENSVLYLIAAGANCNVPTEEHNSLLSRCFASGLVAPKYLGLLIAGGAEIDKVYSKTDSAKMAFQTVPDWKKRIERAKIDLVSDRTLELLFSLHQISCPLPILIVILDYSVRCFARLRFHVKWNICFAVRHFRQR